MGARIEADLVDGISFGAGILETSRCSLAADAHLRIAAVHVDG
jgi:hypothetical protein